MLPFAVTRILVSALVVNVVSVMSTIVLMSVPGTPHRRSVQAAVDLSAFRNFEELNADQQNAANAVFDEFVRLGVLGTWVDMTVIPVVAAVVTMWIWRRTLPLSVIEVVMIAVGFAAVQIWRYGAELPLLVGVVLLATTLALSHSPLIAARQVSSDQTSN